MHEKALTWKEKLTHLFSLHPLMIKHPLDIGIVVWTGVEAEEDK